MNIAAPTLLAGYAYQQAGGGSAGVSAALASLQSSANDVAAMVKQIGSGQQFDLLELSTTKALQVGTYDLQTAAGKGTQVVQDLINPPKGYANPLLGETALNPKVVGAYSKYQYLEAKKAGATSTFTQQTTNDATKTAFGFPGGLYDSALPSDLPAKAMTFFDPKDANEDGFVSPAELLTYSLGNPIYDPQDTNLDGVVSPAEDLTYSLNHPAVQVLDRASTALSSAYYDPQDSNQDGFVSPAEETAYSLKHPEAALLNNLLTPDFTTTNTGMGTQSQTYSQTGLITTLAPAGTGLGNYLDLTA